MSIIKVDWCLTCKVKSKSVMCNKCNSAYRLDLLRRGKASKHYTRFKSKAKHKRRDYSNIASLKNHNFDTVWIPEPRKGSLANERTYHNYVSAKVFLKEVML